MAEMNNYFFVNSNNHKDWVIPGEFAGDYSLAGNGFREGFEDASYIITSPIVSLSLEEGIAITQSGSKYVLLNMSEDYKEYTEALKNKIPVISSWFLEGNLRNRYTLCGQTEGKFISGKIIAQDKNYITLEDGTRYFVIWRNFNIELEFCILITGQYLDMDYNKDFELFGGFKCRPILFK